MRGSIIKRGKDSYTIVVNMGRDPATGKRKQTWMSVKGNKKEAEKKLAELLHQIDQGTFQKPGKTTFADFATRWLHEYATPNLAPKTTEGYASIIRQHLIPSLGNIPLTQLKAEHLQKYYAEKLANGRCDGTGGLCARSVRYHHVTIHIILHTAQKWGLVSRNVADSVDPPKYQRPEMHVLDETGIEKVLNAARSNEHYPVLYMLLFTGMRRSEVLALRWCDVDLIMAQISVSRSIHHGSNKSLIFRAPKTAKGRRTIALPPSACMVLRAHRERQEQIAAEMNTFIQNDSLVFCHYDGTPLLPDTISHVWARLAEHAGYPDVRLHDCRHTHASLMLKQGVHPKIVQERLGHANIGVTLDTYSHVAPGLQQAAAVAFDDVLAHKSKNEAFEKSVSKTLAK